MKHCFIVLFNFAALKAAYFVKFLTESDYNISHTNASLVWHKNDFKTRYGHPIMQRDVMHKLNICNIGIKLLQYLEKESRNRFSNF